jgi:uncharacterized protein
VILVDANLLIYACSPGMQHYERAHRWLDDRLNGIPPVALPWVSLLAFVRIKTNPRAFRLPASIAAAWRQVEDWLDCPRVWIPVPGTNHRAVLGQLLRSGDAAANLVGDAHLAALAIEHGLTLCSADSDFARFPNLRWHNPLHGG